MSDLVSLWSLLATPNHAATTVAWRAGKAISRPQFWSDVQGWATAFTGSPGERVGLYFECAYAFACALLGAWQAGRQVYVPGDARPATLAHVGAQVDVWAGDVAQSLEPVVGQGRVPVDPLLWQRSRLVIFTSGSHGDPVAITKTLPQLEVELCSLQRQFGSTVAAACVYATVSHQHLYGLLFHVLWPLVSGRAFGAERLLYPEDLAARLHAGASVLVSSPAYLKRLPPGLDWSAARTNLRAVFSSGGPLPTAAAQGCRALLEQVPLEIFGSSETGGIAWRQASQQCGPWQPLPGVQWRIDSPTGLLSVRSPHLPDASVWYPTADRVQARNDGGFELLGRADRVVKVAEKRVSLTAMEQALRGCAGVLDARVLVLGEVLGAVVVPSPGMASELAAGKRQLNKRLRQHLLHSLELSTLPRRFRYVAALPTSSQGKTTEAALRTLFRPVLPQIVWRLRSATDAQAELTISPELLAFDGHFDGQPILPGVALLHWAVRWAQSCFAVTGRFSRIVGLKFHKPVLPGAQLSLHLAWSAERGVLNFTYSAGPDRHASGQVVFAHG
jgi:acyl-coenzyme A synthetase/AMP-(fatty) acid ligase